MDIRYNSIEYFDFKQVCDGDFSLGYRDCALVYCAEVLFSRDYARFA